MKKNLLLTMGIYAIAILINVPAAAAEEPPEQILDTIVVTAKIVPTSTMTANANITVVSKKELDRSHYATLTEALRQVSGVSASQYGNGVGFALYNSFALNGSNKYVVLIDGIRANTNGSPYSSFDFDSVAMDTVERIEILKGAASTLYGADAKGGVINIITKSPKKTTTTITIDGGSFADESYRLYHENMDTTYAWSIDLKKSATGDFADGHGRVTPSHGNTASQAIKISKKLSPNADLTLSYKASQTDYAYTIYNASLPASISDTHTVSLFPNDASPQPFTKFMRATTDSDSLSLAYRTKLSSHENLLLSLYRNRTDAVYDRHASNASWIMDVETVGLAQQYTNNFHPKHTLIGGFNYYQDRVNSYQDLTTAYQGKHITNTAFYLQDDWNFDDRWSLTGGTRYEDNSYAGARLSSAFTFGYRPQNHTQYYIGYREHFVAPTQYQLFGPYSKDRLNPETGATIELGLNHKFSKTAAAKATVFHRDSQDTILYDRPIEQYINVGEETANGLDIRLTKRFSPAWQVFAGYTYTKVETRKDNHSAALARDIPQQEISFSLNYTKNAWDASLSGRGVFERKADLYTAQSYWVWNSVVNYKINPSARLYLKINNLFNQFYSETANSMMLNWEDWYAAPGRSYQFGLVYTL